MTTLDDAAERLIAQLANEIDQIARQRHTHSDYEAILRAAYRTATEAAAKKCEALAQVQYAERDRHYNRACDDCAAAIRGNK